MKAKKQLILKVFLFILIFTKFANSFALDYSKITDSLSEIFYETYGQNEGTTTFRSLLIPIGGRSESLGNSYTGLCDDISFFDYNPAASSILEQTEIAVFHNSWIADSKLETIAASTRFGNFGIGSKLSCFYVPFTEYDAFGTKISGNYYSETTLCLNASYTICPGYKFKGVSIGGNIKGAWRSIPDYANNDTGEIISRSGLSQSALAFIADGGLIFQFNFAKFYNSRQANLRIGISATNFGIAITGFKSENGICVDSPLPSSIGLGISWKPIRPITILAEFRQPVNIFEPKEYQLFWFGSGLEISITDFFEVLTGFQLKGGNPHFSLGTEFEVFKIRMNLNYSLDLTSSFNPVNRISLSAKIKLGDKGRKAIQDKVENLYNQGINFFAKGNFSEAIECWQETLRLNKFFDPAKTSIKIATEYQNMLDEYKETFKTENSSLEN